MTEPRIYLDHNATSPLRPQARDAMLKALEQGGNASSVHGEGRTARRIVEDAREQVAGLVGCRAAEVVFTSGATEANNLALAGGWGCYFVSGVEHESVLLPIEASRRPVVRVSVGRDGQVDLAALADAVLLREAPGERPLLSLQMANNETGVLQDVAAAAEFCRAHGIAVHTDAVQACGRVPVDFAELDIDLLSLSSHKIGGPMGVGALVIRDGLTLPPQIRGGGQERRRRAGTENVAAIAGFGAAATAAQAELDTEPGRLRRLRDEAEAVVLEARPDAIVIGRDADRLANTLCVALPGAAAETTVIKLDLAGVAISAGSACSSGKVGASHVLEAMGLPAELTRCAVRLSLGWNSHKSSLEQFSTRFRRVMAAEPQFTARAVA